MGNAYRIVGFWAAALWLGLAAALAFAQDAYPTKPLRMIAPFPPGGTTDVLSRILAQKLGDSLGRQVVVENRPGAGSNLGHELAAKTAPDGYTLLMSSNVALATNRHLYKRLGFDPDNDFAPISVVATAGPVLVVQTVKGTFEIETYPEDKYLPSYLIYSRHQNVAFHVLFATDVEGDNVRIITAYHPDPTYWSADLKTRRKP